MSWAIDNNPVQTWTPDLMSDKLGLGGDLEKCLMGFWPCDIEAHNVGFERAIYENIMRTRFGWPYVRPERWSCTAARARAVGLPGSLEKAALAAGLEYQKDMAGSRIMQKMRKPATNKKRGGKYHWTSADFATLKKYCAQDVETQRALSKATPQLSKGERKVWDLDQRVNHRGIYCDLGLCASAVDVLDRYLPRINDRLNTLTDGAVKTAGQSAALIRWCASKGVKIANTQVDTITSVLDGQLPEVVREVLALKKSAGGTAVNKYQAILDQADPDDHRVRGAFVYHGAGPGRWSGAGIQPQNFSRGKIKIKDVDAAIAAVKSGVFSEIEKHGPIIDVLATLTRSAICAPEGSRLIAADYSAIEARVLMWLAGDGPSVAAFARGDDIYRLMAAQIFNVPLAEVTSDRRFFGKQAILGLGYQMGADKFRATCTEYGRDISKALAQKVVDTYRAVHAPVVRLWTEVESAAVAAVLNPGAVLRVRGCVSYVMCGPRLILTLPSGREITYRDAQVDEGDFGRAQMTYMGVDTYTRKWSRLRTYGGMLTENIIQGISACLLRAAMLRLDADGWPITMTVHDEIVVETNNPDHNVDRMAEIMTIRPQWADGLPLAAEGWEGMRFRK